MVSSFDITDYYPTPKHVDLVGAAGRAHAKQEVGAQSNAHEKTETFERLTALILQEQYVQTQVGVRIFRCNKGSEHLEVFATHTWQKKKKPCYSLECKLQNRQLET